MSFRPIYEGWDIPGRLSRSIRQNFAGIGLNQDLRAARALADGIARKLERLQLDGGHGQYAFAEGVVASVLADYGVDFDGTGYGKRLAEVVAELIAYEGWFALPSLEMLDGLSKSELWQLEDHLRRVEAIVDHLGEVKQLAAALLKALIDPVIGQQPQLLDQDETNTGDITFGSGLRDIILNAPTLVERVLQLPFAPEFEPLQLTPRLRDRLEYNLHVASGGVPGEPDSVRAPKLPTRQSAISDDKLVEAYLGGTPLPGLFDFQITISLPPATRFEHMHIIGGSGHGKTQTLQHLILHDLDAVASGEASVVVIDSQSDLINTIAHLDLFGSGQPLDGRLVLVDPTDVEWPVALNLFDVGLHRLDQYSKLDRERLTNSILELYDFVLSSLLDAGMTQKQTVIFRYITRLLLHIPNATIHTLRELLEDGGYDRYRGHIEKLQGSARAFFEQEFNGKEFVATKRQVLRRLYGILENQTFERMFSHPKSKLDLFTEMNAGKVILINTAKDLLKENGTEIFGRFFIAMITQAAQERAVLDPAKRLPTFVYIDEANDYFDRNVGIILSQARKYKVGMVLAHQYLGQLEPKLAEAIAANAAIKFAGGVSAKDARALASDLRTDAEFIERQSRLSFAAFIKGRTEHAISLSVKPGQMEALDPMDDDDWEVVRDSLRERYAVHESELDFGDDNDDDDETGSDWEPGPDNGPDAGPDGRPGSGPDGGPDTGQDPGKDPGKDTGEPMKW